ncbi:MAG: hypothetical protein H6726_29930 [Sandaracinaceae bacterium]|nr:hypothetical protein [Sandaracinaceae bacterium]
MRARRYGALVVVGCLGATLLAAACAGRESPPTVPSPAPVRLPALGYAHRLHADEYMLCDEGPEGRLRCYGLTPLQTDEEGWVTFADGFSSVSMGAAQVCGLRAGRVVCWGDNAVTPSDDTHLALCTAASFHDEDRVREVAVSGAMGCIVTDSRTVRCWGDESESTSPTTAVGLVEGAHGLSVSLWQGCALTSDGVRCWGSSIMDDEIATLEHSYRVDVPDPAQVVVGSDSACARSSDGRVFCWGHDYNGSLGRGAVTTYARLGVERVDGIQAVDLVGSERTVCARGEDGRTYCWGDNARGQLGLGHTRRVDTPTHVPALDGALDVAPGLDFICARFAQDGIRCAGDLAPLQFEAVPEEHGPAALRGVTATAVFTSEQTTCIRAATGLRCFGGAQTDSRGYEEAVAGWDPGVLDPDEIADLYIYLDEPCVRWRDGRLACRRDDARFERTGTLALTADSAVVCFVDSTRHVHCAHRYDTDAPVPVAGLEDAALIAMDAGRVCAVSTRGALACAHMRAGRGEPADTLRAGFTDIRALALAGNQTCVVRQGGELVCWEGVARYEGTINGISTVAHGVDQMCVLQEGRVRCIEFVDGRMSLGPAVPGVDAVVQLSTGLGHFCARREDGEVLCWGRNRYAQLGRSLPALRLDFVRIPDVEVTPVRAASFECRENEDDVY